MPVKRLNYFNHQFLEEQDFRDEQHYHLEMRRRHNRALHLWGVADGLRVVRSGNREITVEPGFAIDREGRELVIAGPLTREVTSAEHRGHLHVVLSYTERMEESDRRSNGGVEGYSRITEFTELIVTHEAHKSGPGVTLAIVHLDPEGNIQHIDESPRQMAGSLIAPASVHTRHLAESSVTEDKLAPKLKESLQPEKFELRDGSITMEKLSPELRSAIGTRGWVRLPFKPSKYKPKGMQWGPEAEGEFSVDVAYAHSDNRGARGTMAIPVPAGATRIREFRIAGTARRKVRVQLVRTGWNIRDRKGEATEILSEEIIHGIFDGSFKAERELDEFHSITVAVAAEGESEIWLVAARFE